MLTIFWRREKAKHASCVPARTMVNICLASPPLAVLLCSHNTPSSHNMVDFRFRVNFRVWSIWLGWGFKADMLVSLIGRETSPQIKDDIFPLAGIAFHQSSLILSLGVAVGDIRRRMAPFSRKYYGTTWHSTRIETLNATFLFRKSWPSDSG